MGEVYLAATRGIEGAERPCVVKTIRREHGHDSSFRARFLDETRIQAQLQHPGIAQILEAATTDDDVPYAVVEYIEGRHMGEILARSNQLGVELHWADAVAIGLGFGDALAHVHERTDANGRALEIAHRDLSPQNVMLGYGGDLKLIDFGTAKGQNRRSRTVSGIVYAKPGYVAPEVANQTPGGPPADLYAFGVMIWELVAGRRFLQGDPVEHQAQVAQGLRKLPSLAAQVGAPSRLDEVLGKLTAYRVEERYESARRATRDLVELLKLAPSLADGDRSVRGRIAQLMGRLYPAEPARSRADFARRVALARRALREQEQEESSVSERPGIPEPSPVPRTDEQDICDGLLPGTRYRLGSVISRGGMGEVWEATHLDLGRPVALKLIPQNAASSSEARQRFRSEARAIARLDHPGLVNVHDFGVTSDGRCYYSMELLSGRTLGDVLKQGPLDWKESVRMVLEAASALEAAHRAGIVHRDITPHNLFVTSEGRVKLLDFGVARSAEASEEEETGPCVVGTPEYLSPEQAAGARGDVGSDLYALGVVLYQCVTGRLPHDQGDVDSGTLAALLTAKISVTPAPPSTICPAARLPKGLDRALGRALQRDANKRFLTCGDFVQALETLLRTERNPRTGRWVAWASAAAAFLTVGALGLQLRPTDQARHADQGDEQGRGQVGDVTLDASRSPTRTASPDSESEQAVAMAAAEHPPTQDGHQGSQDDGASLDEEKPAADPAFAETQRILEQHRRGRKIFAHHHMKKLAAKHDESVVVQRGLVTTARGVQAWGEALQAARKWVELAPSAEAYVALARLQRATLQGDPAESLRKALKLDPSFAPARALLEEAEGDKLAQR